MDLPVTRVSNPCKLTIGLREIRLIKLHMKSVRCPHGLQTRVTPKCARLGKPAVAHGQRLTDM
jgi:hypothetical protein